MNLDEIEVRLESLRKARRLIVANRQGLSLEEQLERSVEALEGGGRFVSKEELPTELTLNTTHAILSRIIREGQDKAKLR